MARSIAFPIRLDKRNGSLELSDGNQRVKEQILEILTTRYLGRILRPSFGTEEFIFTSISDPGVVSTKVKFALDNYLSDNINTKVQSRLFSSGRVELDIEFFDSNTNIRGNLTTDFNLNAL